MDTASTYLLLKTTLLSATGQSEPLLLINAGLGIYLGLLALLGTSQASRPALLLAVLLVNFDGAIGAAQGHGWQATRIGINLAWTLAWPCLFIAANHYRRRRWLTEQAKPKPIRTVKLPPDVGGALIHGRFRVIEGRS